MGSNPTICSNKLLTPKIEDYEIGVTKEVIKNFLVDSAETGRHIVYSFRTGKKYYIEVIGNGRGGDWGSYNPASGNIEHKKGDGKYTGSVRPEESVITEENGFKNIEIVEGGSPYHVIEQMDAKYPTIER